MRLAAARVGLVAIAAAGCVSCQMDGKCTQKALENGKAPRKVYDFVDKIDAGTLPGDLCKQWKRLALGLDPAVDQAPGAEQIGGFQWTILFRRGVLHCTQAGVCTAPRIGDTTMEVKGGEPRLDVANVVLTPNRIGPLLADDRVRFIAPTCAEFPTRAALQDLSAVEPDEAGVPPAKGGSPLLRDPEMRCKPRDSNKQWNIEDACVPPASTQPTRVSSTVAVLDTGLDCLDPAIDERIDRDEQPQSPRRCTMNSGKNYLYPDLPPDHCGDAEAPTCSMHGTRVAGVIASNRTDLRGIDPHADLVSIRILHADHDTTVVKPSTTLATAILESGGKRSRIINISATWYSNYPWVAAAIDAVTADGKHLIVAAARRANDWTAYPAAYTTCSDAVIGVAGVGRDVKGTDDTTAAEWVQYGWERKSDRHDSYMVAPGVNVPLLGGTADTDNTVSDNGSSFAAPLVSGAASLIWSSNEFKSCSAAGVREVLECSARITIVGKGYPRKRLHLGCLFGQRDSPICRGARRCIDSAKQQYCR